MPRHGATLRGDGRIFQASEFCTDDGQRRRFASKLLLGSSLNNVPIGSLMSLEETVRPFHAVDAASRSVAARLARGVCRALAAHGYGVLTEFPLRSGRRVDVIGVDARGETVIVEIKTSVADFRSDRKWQEYLEFCDRFYFAVPTTFPSDLLPTDCGLIVADDHDAEILRQAQLLAMNGSRRRAQILKFARTASQRLQRMVDPPL